MRSLALQRHACMLLKHGSWPLASLQCRCFVYLFILSLPLSWVLFLSTYFGPSLTFFWLCCCLSGRVACCWLQGLAFQIVDDLLDILGSSKQLGKPALNDMRAGLATAPVLLAAEEQPGLIALIRRKFKGESDVQYALEMVQASSGIERAKALAAQHARLAAQQVEALPVTSSPHSLAARAALINITHRVLVRTK